MPQFRYRAVTQAGEVVTGEVEAASREEVVRRIEYIGHMPIEAEAANKGILTGSGFSGKSARARDVTLFLRQLALLIGAGLTLEAALQTLADGAGKALSRLVNALRGSISIEHSASAAKASATALYQSFYYLGAVFGSVLPGFAWERWAWPGVVTTCIAALVVALLANWMLCGPCIAAKAAV